mgnify:CR=1 FL=1
MKELIQKHLRTHSEAIDKLHDLTPAIIEAALLCVQALKHRGKLLICGNGGSAADAQHMAAELVGRFITDRPALAAIALTTDTSALTAISNDYGYNSVFSRQVAALAQEGDILLAISTSGNSASILKACEQARELECKVIGLIGRDGGALLPNCDVAITVLSSETAHIQECHIVIIHVLCALIEDGLGLV